jgi:hypothetical protein
MAIPFFTAHRKEEGARQILHSFPDVWGGIHATIYVSSTLGNASEIPSIHRHFADKLKQQPSHSA